MGYPKDWKKVTCHDWYEDERKIWLCLENKNAICEIDKNSKDIKILGSFPHNGLGERDLSLSVTNSEDHIVFCPFKANDIAILNKRTGELEFIDLSPFLDRNKYINTGIEKFYRMVSYKKYIYFFGIKCPAIMRLDIKTKKIDIFDDWLEEVERHKCKEAVLFTDGYAQKENEIFLPIGRCSGVLKMDLDTMGWDYIEIKPAVRGILGMTQKDELVWFTEYDKGAEKFFQWNLDDGRMTEISLPCQDAFYAPLYHKRSLLFFQNTGKKSYRYGLETGEWEDITNIMPELKGSSDKKAGREEEVHYFSNKSGRFYHWNPSMKMASYDEFQIEKESFLENSWADACERCKKGIMKEDRLTLRDFVEEIVPFPACISSEKGFETELIEKKELCAEQIWRVL